MVELIKSLNPSKYVFQMERGEETKLLHYQGFIKLPSKKNAFKTIS